MKNLFVILLTFFMFNCKSEKQPEESTQEAIDIVNKSIKASGSEKVGNTAITFKFRDKSYRAKRQNGSFELERNFADSINNEIRSIRDVLNNDGFRRYSDGKEIRLNSNKSSSYSASVNSVHYFSVLPFGLNDKSVNKTKKDNVTINGTTYYTIQVTFNKDGGGEDYDDVFLYWINTKTYLVDFLAYSYSEPNGRGLRFRQAYNERIIERIRFVDYYNFKPKDKASISLLDFPKLFENGALELLSKIELENVAVN